QAWRPNIASASTGAVTVPAGVHSLQLKAVGSGTPPRIALTGPDGQHYAMPDDGSQVGAAGAIHYFTDADTHTTYVGVWPVARGTWRATALPGSTINQLYKSFPMPPARISATVTDGPGRTRLLHYRVQSRPGQKVEFVERGRDTAAVIGYANGASGTLRFSP